MYSFWYLSLNVSCFYYNPTKRIELKFKEKQRINITDFLNIIITMFLRMLYNSLPTLISHNWDSYWMTHGQRAYTVWIWWGKIRGRMEQDVARFHHNTQNGVQYKICELFTFEIFHLIVSDQCWLWMTETKDKWGLLYFLQVG